MNAEQKKYLVKTIEEAGEWERIETTVDGLFVVKPQKIIINKWFLLN